MKRVRGLLLSSSQDSNDQAFILISLTTCDINVFMSHTILMLSILGKIFSEQHLEYFSFFFFQREGFDIPCKVSPMETIYMKCQSLFSGKK